VTQSRSLPSIVDTHTHLDEPVFDADRDVVMAAARRAGVRQFINIGYKPRRWESSRVLRDSHPDVAIVVGLHPQEAAILDSVLDRELLRAIEDLRPIAIGETGFDFARTSPTPREQERAFRRQLEIASGIGLPVVIHQRQAADALTSELERWPGLAPIVLHSFHGDRRLADWAIERDCYIGVGGLATKPASIQLREQLARMSPQRLLLETDSPYLAPPGTESRRNTPANLPSIAARLAPLWSLNGEELCRISTQNADAAFDLHLADNSSVRASV
jgi:TatD DNase family protein